MPSQAGDCFYTRLLKVDAELGTSQEWKEEGTFPGEPIFVPHPEASKEDQGVLLSVVLAGKTVTVRHVSKKLSAYSCIQVHTGVTTLLQVLSCCCTVVHVECVAQLC